MSTLASLLGEHLSDAEYPNTCICETEVSADEFHYAKHLAALVADWLTSDEVVEVVARALRSEERNASMSEVDWGDWEDAGEEERGAYRHLAREQFAALAAHAKGETP